jgi:hypothetical protein
MTRDGVFAWSWSSGLLIGIGAGVHNNDEKAAGKLPV